MNAGIGYKRRTKTKRERTGTWKGQHQDGRL